MKNPDSMKILYITIEDISIHKGSVVHIKEVTEGLRKRGHFVGLVAYSSNRQDNIDKFYNLKVITRRFLKIFGLSKQPYIISFFFLFIFLMKCLNRYDIIYARDYHTVIIAFLPRILFKKKLIFEANGLANEEQRLKSPSVWNHCLASIILNAEKIATRLSDQIITVTPNIKFYFVNRFICRKSKVRVIGNGVNIEKFFPITDPNIISQWKAKYGVGLEELVVIFVGNLARWQGVDILVESGLQLLKKIKNVRFIIVGDGAIKEDLVKKILATKEREKFIFTGMVDYSDIPYLLNIADLGIAPLIPNRNLITGVSPLKVYEYLACGKPVVTTRIAGLEFIEEEDVGKLVEPGETRNFVDTIYGLLKDQSKREAMGRKGVQMVKENFNWESKIQNIEKVLKESI